MIVSMSRSSKRLGIPEGQNKSRQISASSSTVLPRPRRTRSAKRPNSRPQKLAHEVGAVAQNPQYVGPNGPPFDSRGIGGADDSAHRRAGDGYGANPHFLQGFERQDMGNSSCATASERDRYPRSTNIWYGSRLPSTASAIRFRARSPANQYRVGKIPPAILCDPPPHMLAFALQRHCCRAQ